MAQAAVQLDRRAFICAICFDLLKDPATLPCGHNYCRSCVQTYWDREVQSCCPQCRQRFSPRPVLVTNTMLADLVEQLKRTELQPNFMSLNLLSHVPSDIAQWQQQLQTGRGQVLQTIQHKEAALQKIQQDVLSFRHCADGAVKHSEQSFSGLVRELENVHNEVTRQIRELQEKEEAQLKQLYDQLQQDVTELRKTISELDSLTPGQTLQHQPTPSALDPPRTYSLPQDSLTHVSSAVTALTDLLKVTLKDGLQNISQSFRPDYQPTLRPEAALALPEPKTREEFINYAREIILDPNTAHEGLSLSRGNRQAARYHSYSILPDHPDRFDHFYQVMSSEGLTGRCYWEVEWGILEAAIAVTYKTIRRKGDSEDCEFGCNDKSWTLDCKGYKFSFWHHSVETRVSRSVSNRIGVYLDQRAGVLAFYNIDQNQSMSLLHRVQTKFTQPFYAGVRLVNSTDTAYFPKLK